MSLISTILVVVIICFSPDQTADAPVDSDSTYYRVMFYNTENLFDPVDDSLTDDGAFTPSGDMHWTGKRYRAKLINISKVIIALGQWHPPDIIGLCEIENNKVLHDLIEDTPLVKFPYHIVHEESPDRRGIDVALLYNAKTVRYLNHQCYSLKKNSLVTRDILGVEVLIGQDTCYVFINHWPSRSAGQLETEKDRIAAANLLKQVTDSLFRVNTLSRIIILGDFNDEPHDISLMYKLNARIRYDVARPAELYNITYAPQSGAVKGTLKYHGEWNLFDQVIVSGSLLPGNDRGLIISNDGYTIMQHPFLLCADESYTGMKPFRTYIGFRYQGGFSDHLPVYVDLVSR
jgi:endonuclease/exonuclease/phosphatase family metal-dependent hydrolase